MCYRIAVLGRKGWRAERMCANRREAFDVFARLYRGLTATVRVEVLRNGQWVAD